MTIGIDDLHDSDSFLRNLSGFWPLCGACRQWLTALLAKLVAGSNVSFTLSADDRESSPALGTDFGVSRCLGLAAVTFYAHRLRKRSFA
jgi:hypothetical protein